MVLGYEIYGYSGGIGNELEDDRGRGGDVG